MSRGGTGANEGRVDGRHLEGLLIWSGVKYFASDVPRPPREGHLEMKEETAVKMLKEDRASDYVAKLKWVRQEGSDLLGATLRELLFEEQGSFIAATVVVRLDSAEGMARDDYLHFGSMHEVDVDHRTRDVNGLLRLGRHVSVSDRVTRIMQRGEGFLGEYELTHVFVPNGRWAAGPGNIGAKTTRMVCCRRVFVRR